MIRWKRIVNMAVAHIRRPIDAANFELVFRYQNPEIGIDRVYNLQRSISETIGTTLNRIKMNVEKEQTKKLKKTKKSKQTSTDAIDAVSETKPIEVEFVIDKNTSTTTTWSEVFANANDHEFKTAKLKIFGQEFSVAFNYPYVSQGNC